MRCPVFRHANRTTPLPLPRLGSFAGWQVWARLLLTFSRVPSPSFGRAALCRRSCARRFTGRLPAPGAAADSPLWRAVCYRRFAWRHLALEATGTLDMRVLTSGSPVSALIGAARRESPPHPARTKPQKLRLMATRIHGAAQPRI